MIDPNRFEEISCKEVQDCTILDIEFLEAYMMHMFNIYQATQFKYELVVSDIQALLIKIYQNFYITYGSVKNKLMRSVTLFNTRKFSRMGDIVINNELKFDYLSKMYIMSLPEITPMADKERLFPSKGTGFVSFPLHVDIKFRYE